jgi:hypothetical protein
LNEALGLAVGLRSIGLGKNMAQAELAAGCREALGAKSRAAFGEQMVELDPAGRNPAELAPEIPLLSPNVPELGRPSRGRRGEASRQPRSNLGVCPSMDGVGDAYDNAIAKIAAVGRLCRTKCARSSNAFVMARKRCPVNLWSGTANWTPVGFRRFRMPVPLTVSWQPRRALAAKEGGLGAEHCAQTAMTCSSTT